MSITRSEKLILWSQVAAASMLTLREDEVPLAEEPKGEEDAAALLPTPFGHFFSFLTLVTSKFAIGVRASRRQESLFRAN